MILVRILEAAARITAAVVRRLRRHWFEVRGLNCGHSTNLQFIRIDIPVHVKIGNFCNFEKNSELVILSNAGKSGRIDIKDHVHIGANTIISSGISVMIGEDVMIGPNCVVIDSDHGFVRSDRPMRLQSGNFSAIIIGRDVWVGAGVNILKGAVIGTGAIIGAGAVVTGTIPDFEIWGGIPARKISVRTKS